MNEEPATRGEAVFFTVLAVFAGVFVTTATVVVIVLTHEQKLLPDTPTRMFPMLAIYVCAVALAGWKAVSTWHRVPRR
jgi:hypothetical protein